MISYPNARRQYADHAPLPVPRHLNRDCVHGVHGRDYCTECQPEGTVIHLNQDIERRACLGPYEGNV